MKSEENNPNPEILMVQLINLEIILDEKMMKKIK